MTETRHTILFVTLALILITKIVHSADFYRILSIFASEPTNQLVLIMRKSILFIVFAALCAAPANAQLLNRLTDKALKAAEKGVGKAVEKSVEKTTEKATQKLLNSAENAVDAQVNKATTAIDQSTNEINASIAEANRAADSIRVANGQAPQAAGAGLAGLMGSYMTLMGAGSPTLVKMQVARD